jgi:hypothetical protein
MVAVVEVYDPTALTFEAYFLNLKIPEGRPLNVTDHEVTPDIDKAKQFDSNESADTEVMKLTPSFSTKAFRVKVRD